MSTLTDVGLELQIRYYKIKNGRGKRGDGVKVFPPIHRGLVVCQRTLQKTVGMIGRRVVIGRELGGTGLCLHHPIHQVHRGVDLDLDQSLSQRKNEDELVDDDRDRYLLLQKVTKDHTGDLDGGMRDLEVAVGVVLHLIVDGRHLLGDAHARQRSHLLVLRGHVGTNENVLLVENTTENEPLAKLAWFEIIITTL